MSTAPLVLSARWHGHTADVRAIASYALADGTDLILSGSRDQCARLWVRLSDGSLSDVHVLDNGSGFVNAVAFFEQDGTLYALSAGQDTLIHAFRVDAHGSSVSVSTTPQFSLLGHSSNVCSLRTYKSDYIVSGSWDSTVKVWKRWNCVATLSGHTHSVWSVLPIDDDRILSASADKTVCLWSLSSPQEPIYTYEGATQAVRDLARLNDASFVCAGNDGQLRVLPILGGAAAPRTIATLPSFVYALCCTSTEHIGESSLISCGEDRCFRVWRQNTLSQLVPIPALSVWCVCTLSNGDVACGASDGLVSIFTRDDERAAPADVARAFADELATQSLSAPEVQGVAVKEDRAALHQPGRHEGDMCVVREGSKSSRFHWSVFKQQWIHTGIVTEGAASSSKTEFQGKLYDYVFDVDIADGVPPLKLPYNVTENTYVAASRFLEQNNLPASFLDQVVRFLEKNTQAVGLSSRDQAADAVDPYTGGSRYIPDSSNGPSPSAPAPTSLKTLPQTQYLSFSHTQLDAAHAKLRSFSTSVPGATLTDDDAQDISKLVAALGSGSGVMNVDVLSKLLHTWPVSARFPLLDLLRAAALHPCTQPFPSIVSDALVGADWDALDAPGIDAKVASANAMLALRTLANGFATPNGPATMDALALEALATLRHPPWHILNRPGQTALATVALNYSIRAVTQPKFEQASLLLDLIADVRSFPLCRILTIAFFFLRSFLSPQKANVCIEHSWLWVISYVLKTLTTTCTTNAFILQLCAPCSSSISTTQRSAAVQTALSWREKISGEVRIQNVCADLCSWL